MITLAHFYTFGVGLVGALTFLVLGFPLPWLLGTLSACLVAAIIGIEMKAIKPLNEAMRTIVGVAVGATISVTLLVSMIAMWPTLLLIPVMVILIGVIGVPYFHRLWGYDWVTSYYSAMPGGLQDMLVFGEEAGGNVRAMSLIHATRVLIIVMAVPFLMQAYWQADLTNPPGAAIASIAPQQIVILIFCGLAGWQAAKFVGMSGASILGPLILAAAASLAGILHTRPPAEAVWLAQYFIAITVGVKYVGITQAEVRRDILAGLGYCGILIVITVIFTGIIHALDLAPSRETLLSFAPGGQAELVVLALIVGADMAFVVTHHLVRIFFVILCAPYFERVFRKIPLG